MKTQLTLINDWVGHCDDILVGALTHEINVQAGEVLGIATAAFGGDRHINYWNTKQDDITHALPLHGLQPTALCVTTSYIIAGGLEGTHRVWNTKSGVSIKASNDIWLSHRQPVTAISIHPHGTTVASGSADGTLYVWNIQNKQQKSTTIQSEKFTHKSGITAIKHSPDNQWIVVTDCDGNVVVWDITDVQHVTLQHVWSLKNAYLQSSASSSMNVYESLHSSIHFIAYHPTDLIVAIVTPSTIVCYDLEQMHEICVIHHNTPTLQSIIYTTTGNALLLISENSILPFSVETQQCVDHAIVYVDWREVCDLAYVNDESNLLCVICKRKNTIYLHEYDTTSLIAKVDDATAAFATTDQSHDTSLYHPPINTNFVTQRNAQLPPPGGLHVYTDHHTLAANTQPRFTSSLGNGNGGGGRLSLGHTTTHHWNGHDGNANGNSHRITSQNPMLAGFKSPQKGGSYPKNGATISTTRTQLQTPSTLQVNSSETVAGSAVKPPKSPLHSVKFNAPKYVIEAQNKGMIQSPQHNTPTPHPPSQPVPIHTSLSSGKNRFCMNQNINHTSSISTTPSAHTAATTITPPPAASDISSTPTSKPTFTSPIVARYKDLILNETGSAIIHMLEKRLELMQTASKHWRKGDITLMLKTLYLGMSSDNDVFAYHQLISESLHHWKKELLSAENCAYLLPIIQKLLDAPVVSARETAIQLLSQILPYYTKTVDKHALQHALTQANTTDALNSIKDLISQLATSTDHQEIATRANEINFRLQRLGS